MVTWALLNAGLKGNPAKCCLGQREGMYLGYTLGWEWLDLLMDKVQVLTDCLIPSTKKHMRCFLGLAAYQRQFVPDFTTITTPLTNLMKDTSHKKAQWMEACDRAFRTLKDWLMGGQFFSTLTS